MHTASKTANTNSGLYRKVGVAGFYMRRGLQWLPVSTQVCAGSAAELLTYREASALEADGVVVDVVDGQDGVEYFSNGVVSVVEYALVEAGKERTSGR